VLTPSVREPGTTAQPAARDALVGEPNSITEPPGRKTVARSPRRGRQRSFEWDVVRTERSDELFSSTQDRYGH
jgi:hypothetical protein